MKAGELVTPTGVLVMDAETMRSDREAWLAARRWRKPDDMTEMEAFKKLPMDQAIACGYRIGSSEVPSILDLDGVDTPAHVYASKVHGTSTPVNEAMRWGQVLEKSIADEWTRLNRCVTDEVGLLAHVDTPWHQTTIDRRVRECPTVKGLTDGCLAEVKNVGHVPASRWHAEIPDRILAQVVHQLYVTGYEHAHVVCLVGGSNLRHVVVRRDQTMQGTPVADIMAYIVGEVDRFRSEHLLTGVEPEWNVMGKPEKMLALDRMLHPVRAGEIGLDGIDDVMEYARLSRLKGDTDKALSQLKAKMAQMAAGAELVLFSDEPAYGYRTTKRTHVSPDRLAERYPDAYNDPEVTKHSTSPTLWLAGPYKVKPKKG